MKKSKFIVLILVLALACGAAMAACSPKEPTPEPTLYTVTFVTNGGSAVPDQGVYGGKKVSKPGAPTRDGYDFENWYKEEGLTTVWNFDTDTVAANTTLYAKWTLKAASEDSNFVYALVGDSYTIAKKTGVTLAADIILPSLHENKAVTAIADNAFENETALKSVAIPDSITEIGKQAFRNCTALVNINEAKNIAQIGSNAFFGTAWDTNLVAGDVYLGKTYYKFSGGMYTDAEIVIADGTLGVAAGAFDSKDKLIAVTLPTGLQYIGDYAFGGAQKGTSLTEITLPLALKRIGNNAFRNSKLTAVSIGASVEFIGDSAFVGCPVATVNYAAVSATFGSIAAFNNNATKAELTIAANVTAYPTGIFTNFTGLEKIDFGGVTDIPANAFDKRAAITQISFGGVAKIGNYAFRGTGITTLTLPASLTELGNGVFVDNVSLTEITYNATNLTKSPGASALTFGGCALVNKITVGANVTALPAELFRGLAAVTALDIGSPVSIGAHALFGIGVTTLTVPASVTSIGADAFGGNSALTTVAFNATEASLESGAESLFSGCTALATVTVASGVKNIPAYFLTGNTLVTEIELPESVVSIGRNAFNGCTALATIAGVDTVSNIGNDAFTGTPWLDTYLETPGLIYLGSVLYSYNGDGMPSNYTLEVRAGTTSISPNAFKNKTNLTAITLPSSLTEIGASAFEGCKGLTQIVLPSSVTTLGAKAFKGCTNIATADLGGVTAVPENAFYGDIKLTSVTMENVTSIGNSAFYQCGELGAITFNEGLKSIGVSAFGATKLASVTIPESVTTIGDQAFAACTSLTSATINCPTVGTNMFFRCTALARVTFGDKVASIGMTAFQEDTALTSINLNKVKTIGDKAFNGTGLTSLTLPATLTKIGDYAFDSCKSLNSDLVIPNSVVELGTGAFKGTGIKSVVIPGTLKSVSGAAFRECESLASVTINDGVESIGVASFMMCPMLKTITLPQSIASIGGSAFEWVTKVNLNASLTATVDATAFNAKTVFITDNVAGYRASTGWKVFASRIISQDMLVDNDFVVEQGVLTLYIGSGGTVTLPASVTSIKAGAFGSAVISAFGVASASTTYSAVDGNLLSKDGTEFIMYAYGKIAASCTIPESVTKIADGAFGIVNNALTTVVLTATTPPTLGANVFNRYIINIQVPAECGETYRTASGWSAYADYILGEGENVREFVIINGVLEEYNGEGGEVVLPDNVMSVKATAFQNNTTITKLTINKNLKSIDEKAFDGATNLTAVVFNAIGFTDRVADNSGLNPNTLSLFPNMTTLEIGADVTKIPNAMFLDCYNLTSVTIPATVTAIGKQAFYMRTAGSSKLAALIMQETNEGGVAKGVSTIGKSSFENCAITGDLIIPSTITFIDDDAFKGNTTGNITLIYKPIAMVGQIPGISNWIANANVTEAQIAEGVTILPIRMFKASTSLTKINFPESLTDIGTNCFNGCTNLALDLVIPANVTVINAGAFMGTAITSLTLNDNLTQIANAAFQNCAALNGTLALPAGLTNLGNFAFVGTNYTKVIYNCTGKLEGSNTTTDGLFPNTVTEVEFGAGVTTIASGMFINLPEIKTVAIPEGVTEIANNAFRNNTSIVSITLPESLVTIGDFGFFGCTSLTEIIIPDSVTTMGKMMFAKNSSLKKVTFGASLTTIGTTPLRECTVLEEVIFKSIVPPALFDAKGLFEDAITPTNFVIKVPADSVEAYKTATNWTKHAGQIVANTPETI